MPPPPRPIPAHSRLRRLKQLDCEGADLAALDTANLQLRETLTEQQVERFSSRHDIGKYFKRVEWSGDRPRFVLGNDHAKLYPED